VRKTTDGGDSWERLGVGKDGGKDGGEEGRLPELMGKVRVAVSPARPERVWAIVEAEDGALLRSDDGGATWQRQSEERALRLRPWYYCHVIADPRDPDTVYVLNVRAWKSTDGGRTFTELTTPHGDNHDLWIDPRDPRRMIEGNDGGACVSWNGGASWSSIYNQPTAQFYHVATDRQFPYRVYGTQQDNSAMSVPSRSYKGAILAADGYAVGSSESGHIAVHPDDPNVVFSGAVGSAPGGGGVLLRYDHRTGQTRIVTVWPELYGGWGARDLKYRFQWTYPIMFSPHDSSVLYTSGNVVFRSTDQGGSWEAISPDLTRNDVSKLGPSGGPITRDTTGAEHYATVFALAESPHEPGVLWAGSDDGLLHVSRDGGGKWERVTLPDLPEWATICTIELSPHDPARAYVAATCYKLDDPRPYLFRTTDSGRSWRSITQGIPADDFTRVIREDPSRPGLLYAGTETGIHVSLDDGESWQPLQRNLPRVPVYDLTVKDGDLVAATHGRAFWILDDLTPLHQLRDEIAGGAHLFRPRPAYRMVAPIGAGRVTGPGKNYFLALGYPGTFYEDRPGPGEVVRRFIDAGTNPPNGLVLTYYLPADATGEVTVRVLDGRGRHVKAFSSEPGRAAARDRRLPKGAGMHRFLWNMRYADAREVPADVTTERLIGGPPAPPGVYTIELTVDGRTMTTPAEIGKDPRLDTTPEEHEAQLSFYLAIRDKLSEMHDAINQIRDVRRQLGEWGQRSGGDPSVAVTEAARTLGDTLWAIEQELIEGRVRADGDMIHFPARLNAKLAALTNVVGTADAPPTRQAREVFQDLSARIDAQLERWRTARTGDLAALNEQIRGAGLPAIAPRS
ncbi:MAG TPA: hypothetical protein VML54_14715, partial [Candidatus Limnocylindrales bacterium]|nr:hypothetical protein [Candidatus Limnocylindrales bacterium]